MTPYTPGQTNVIRWTHFRTTRRARKDSIEAVTYVLWAKGVDVSQWQVRQADKRARTFQRMCDTKPGFFDVITSLYGVPEDLKEPRKEE